jgi:hypothetical protein
MKTLIASLVLSGFMFAAPPPKFGWKELVQQTFALNATEHKDFPLPKGKLRISIQAEDAVYIGVVTAEQYAPFRNNKTYLTLEHFRKFHCVNQSVLQGNTGCNVGVQGTMLLVRDKRGPLTKYGATTVGTISTVRSAGTAGAGMAEHATKPNKVLVIVSSWQCVENCSAANQ